MAKGTLRRALVGCIFIAGVMAIFPAVLLIYGILEGTAGGSEFGQLAGATATALATIAIAGVTFLLVDRTRDMAQANLQLTRLREIEHQRDRPWLELVRGTYGRDIDGDLVHEAALFDVMNVGRVPAHIRLIGLVSLEDGREIMSNDPFVVHPPSRQDGELRLDPGEMVSIQAPFARVSDLVPGTPVALVVKPVGSIAAATTRFDYPGVGEQKHLADRLPLIAYVNRGVGPV